MSETILAACEPNRDRLLALVSEEIDDSMLQEIAEADYGCDVEEHLPALKQIRDKGKIPVPLGWRPREVLELIRWSQPEDPKWKPGSMGKRGHLMRAFCCATLLRAGVEPENRDYLEGENQTVVQLLVSLGELNQPAIFKAALSFFAYRLSSFDEKDEERPFFIFALLLLMLKCEWSDRPGDIAEVADWLLRDEERIRNSEWAVLPEGETSWLLGLTFYDLRHSAWITQGKELVEFSAIIEDTKTKSLVLDIASRLGTGLKVGLHWDEGVALG